MADEEQYVIQDTMGFRPLRGLSIPQWILAMFLRTSVILVSVPFGDYLFLNPDLGTSLISLVYKPFCGAKRFSPSGIA